MMFFTITANGETIYDPTLIQNGRGLISPKLTLELGKAGSLSFTMPPDNVYYDYITKLSTVIRVYRNSVLIFKGRVLDIERDFYNRKRVMCEGMLAYLNDSNMRPYGPLTLDVSDFLSLAVDNHNAYVEAGKRFTVGSVSVNGVGEVDYESIDYTPTLDLLTNELTDKYGGYFRTRVAIENGVEVNYLDYLTAYDQIATQQIEFGKNLLDITEYITAEDVFTVLIPLGDQEKDAEGTVTGRVDITSVNNGNEYLENASGINLFGRIEKVQIWEDITSPSELKSNAQLVLNKGVDSNIKLTLSAVDLNLVDSDVEAYELGDIVRVLSEPHNIDMLFQIIKMDIDIASPSQTSYEFSADYDELPTTRSSNTLRAGGTAQLMAEGTNEETTTSTGGYKLTKDNKSGSTTITEKTLNGQKSTDKVSNNVVAVQNELGGNISGTRLANGSVTSAKLASNAATADKIATNAVTTGKIQDGAVTASKIENASGTDWLGKLNLMLEQSSDTDPVAIGSYATFHATADYIQFDSDDGGYVRLYHTPITSSTYRVLVVFKTTGGTFYGLCTGTDGIVTISDPDE